MAEVFGVITGAVGIASAFTTCVDCFNYVQAGRHIGRDYQTKSLELTLVQLRLSRWGEAVHIFSDPKLGKSNASQRELDTARDTLIQILVLFSETKKISKNSKLEDQDVGTLGPQDGDAALQLLTAKMATLATKRQKGTSLLKGFREAGKWALYGKEEFTALIDGITALVNGLEMVFPAPEPQRELVQEEVSHVPTPDDLIILEKLSAGIDEILQKATAAAISSVPGQEARIRNIENTEYAKMFVGDTFSAYWKGQRVSSNTSSTWLMV